MSVRAWRLLVLGAMTFLLGGCEAVLGVGTLSERKTDIESSQDVDADADADAGPVVDDSGPMDSGKAIRDSGKAMQDSAVRDSGGVLVDSDPPPEDAGVCAPGSAAFTPPAYVPAIAAQGVCAAGDIASFITACGASATQAACGSWQDANVASSSAAGTACGNCIMAPANNGGTSITVGMDGLSYFGPNYAGCLQLAGAQNGTACGNAWNDIVACEDLACLSAVCDSDPDASADCYMPVDQGSCSTYLASEQSACNADYGDGGAFDMCHPSLASNDSDDDLSYIIGLICGAASGGVDSGAPQDAGHVSDSGPPPPDVGGGES